VRNNLSVIASRAAESRARARELSGSCGEAAMAAVDDQEKTDLLLACTEVYIGFHELDSLLLTEPDEHPQPVPPPPPPSADDQTRLARIRLELYPPSPPLPGVRFKHLLEPISPLNDGPIPPDLVEAFGSGPLGREAIQVLWDRSAGEHFHGEKWWTLGLPNLVRLLIDDCAASESHLAVSRSEHLASASARLVSTQEYFANLKSACEDIEELVQENDTLRGQLKEAQAREDALHTVISRCIDRHSAMT